MRCSRSSMISRAALELKSITSSTPRASFKASLGQRPGLRGHGGFGRSLWSESLLATSFSVNPWRKHRSQS
jgi:hypothetical protein